MPWESWDTMVITLSPWEIREIHGVSNGKHGCVTASRGTPDKMSQYVHHINDTLGRLDRATN
jgi:hypothetical protein